MIHLIRRYPPDEMWEEITDQKRIEKIIVQRNKRHLQQAEIEGGRSQDPVMLRMEENFGDNDLVDDLHKGKITLSEATDEVILAFVRALQETASKVKLPPVTGEVGLREAYQAAYRAVSEKTTSSPAGLHYTIWKSVSSVDEFAEWLSIMMSLPYMYGFVNERWATEINAMLEKKRGVRKIHLLQIIGILEADFNTALKIYFAQRLMRLAEATGLHDEQWGSRPNRTSTDPALRKMMTFKYGRYIKTKIALFANDQRACFDRMRPKMDCIVAGTFGMDTSVLAAKVRTMEAMKHYIKTALGVSRLYYCMKRGEPAIQGEIQGKGDVASMWAMVSSLLLLAFESLYEGIYLHSVCGRKGIRKRNDGYVDDVDTWAAQMGNNLEAIKLTEHQIAEGAQKWANIQDVVAQSMAFHKCAFHMLVWKEVRSSLIIDYDYSAAMTLHDTKGAGTSIKCPKPDKPNVGLGFCQASDGNQDHEFSNREGKIQAMCKTASGMMLNQSEAWIMLTRRLIPQTTYGMRLPQFNQKQCHKLDVQVMRVFLPLLKVNRKMPRAVVHGPLQYGGMNILKHSALQDQWGLHYFVQSLRWDKIVANDILTVLDAYQQVSGQKLQRLHDDSIMEVVVARAAVTKRVRLLTNECRIWLRVTTVADVATVTGAEIPCNRLFGGWRADPISGREWPDLPTPSKAHWAAFRKCLRLAFCSRASPWQRQGSYNLDQPLGQWFPVERNVKVSCYISATQVYQRDEFKCYSCVEADAYNFYEIDYDNPSEPPLESHPIPFRHIESGRFWIWKQYNPFLKQEKPSSQTVLRDEFTETKGKAVHIVSDASVYIKDRKAAGAWHMFHAGEPQRRVAIPLEHHLFGHSYRSELETFYHALVDANNILQHPHTIHQYMDCKAGLVTLEQPLFKPSQTMAPDMDVVMAYRDLRSRIEHSIQAEWVMGHADTKKKDKPETITPI
ncbi:hypothetical protein ACHAWF_007008 [Thalassiosira exigua]